MNTISPSPRLTQIDSLRGIAAFLVLIYHYFYRYDELYGHNFTVPEWLKLGSLGVELFFIVSGFVIYLTVIKTERKRDFCLARFTRLYPTYWACITLTFLVVVIFGLEGREVNLGNFILNFLMFQEYLKQPHVDGVYWTLTIELTFYFWVFVLFMFGFKKKLELCFVPFILLYLCQSSEFTIFSPVRRLLILDYIVYFFIGICFYNIFYKVRVLFNIMMLSVGLAVVFIVKDFFDGVSLLIVCFIFAVALFFKFKILNNKLLLFLGSISYPLYLLHQNIGYVIIRMGYDLSFSPLISIFIATLISLILASIVHFLIEKKSKAIVCFLIALLRGVTKVFRKNVYS